VLKQVPTAAGLRPAPWLAAAGAGRDGVHTEALGPLLAELQSVARPTRGRHGDHPARRPVPGGRRTVPIPSCRC
jgi:hypothetical protein